jgi:large conductance mechanosensitive channel
MAKIIQKAKGIVPEKIEKRIDDSAKKTGGFFSEFKKFAIKGNAMELAIGVVIGAAFKGIVDSLVNDIIMPPIGFLTGNVDFSNLYINLSSENYSSLAEAEEAGAPLIRYGLFINAFINFLIIALVIFLIIKYINKITHEDEQKEKKVSTKKCPFCLEEIKTKATRCKFCTMEVPVGVKVKM